MLLSVVERMPEGESKIVHSKGEREYKIEKYQTEYVDQTVVCVDKINVKTE